MFHILFLIFFALNISHAEDPGALLYPADFAKDLSAIRGTKTYEAIIDDIISKGIMRLTLAVDDSIHHTSNNTNVVFAPVSIAGALALILLGANGKTLKEMTTLMGLTAGIDIEHKSQIVHDQFGRMIQKLEQSSGFDIGKQVNFATGMFVQDGYPIRAAYKSVAQNVYQAEVINLDFEKNSRTVQRVINQWFFDRTNGKIMDMLQEPPDYNTKVILASAMHFQAAWATPFIDGATNKRNFFPNGRKNPSTMDIDLMVVGGEFPHYKDPDLKCEILGLPYKGNQSTMYVVMPFDSDSDKLRELSNKMTENDLIKLVSHTKVKDAVVGFPKMVLDSTIDLKQTMQILGVESLFDPQRSNLALLSPGYMQNPVPFADKVADFASINAQAPSLENSYNRVIGDDGEEIHIWNRNSMSPETAAENCTSIFNPETNITTCEEKLQNNTTVKLKKIDGKIGRKVIKRQIAESLDDIRAGLNKQANPEKYENPGLFVDRVVHKVFINITETGTEAAAATYSSTTRSGGKVVFRVDVPFLFFILHEETKVVMFWGSVFQPVPSYTKK